MRSLSELQLMISSLSPLLSEDEFVFLSRPLCDNSMESKLNPIATILETEGRTLVVTKAAADAQQVNYSGVFRRITLQVYSSLEAVGLTAVVSTALFEKGISANVIAGFHHDHIFVPSHKADLAVQTLNLLSNQA